jgi:hypothetical protein
MFDMMYDVWCMIHTSIVDENCSLKSVLDLPYTFRFPNLPNFHFRFRFHSKKRDDDGDGGEGGARAKTEAISSKKDGKAGSALAGLGWRLIAIVVVIVIDRRLCAITFK